jgi:hypothetical protein
MKQKSYQILMLLVLGLFFALSGSAQNDVILKTNGEEMEGKVTKINKTDLQFVYKNETIEYTVEKADIVKITFASGRIEFFNKDNNKETNANLGDHHNKVAILPFGYIKDQETSNPTMTEKIQQETYTIFKKYAVSLQFQDPFTTNALLAKAGINNNNIQGYTMGEICNILGVEYVVQGLVSIEKSTVTNYGNTYSTDKSKGSVTDKMVGDIWNSKSSSSHSSINTTTQNYSTNITMNIFTDKGENIFTKEHSSFWQTQDAYKITLTYLAKRTPIYKK